MYEHKTMYADKLPAADQLDDLSKDGWEMFHLIPDSCAEGEYVIYLRRLKPVS